LHLYLTSTEEEDGGGNIAICANGAFAGSTIEVGCSAGDAAGGMSSGAE
jgi:hypothetical protein